MSNACNILCVGADKNNSTDGVIVRGIYNILDSVFIDNKKEYLILNDHNPMTTIEKYKDKKIDYVVVCGTPWLWDSFQLSVKYKNLEAIFNNIPNAKKIFMGIGSCINANAIGSNLLKKEEDKKHIENLYKDSLIITRDFIAKDIIENAGLKCFHLPCPSYFCYGLNTKNIGFRKTNILIWCDPSRTISGCDWKDKKKLENYYLTNFKFYERYKPEVYCAKKYEISSACKIGLSKPKVLNGHEETLSIMRKAKYVLSGRVHCAVPAFLQGAILGILPLDSRCYVLTEYGCPAISNHSELNTMKTCKIDLEKAFNNYKTILSEFKN